ncbi:MAG: VOC family protein [Anaerolineales bacterium]
MNEALLKDKPITQIGLVVDDIEKAALAWAGALGVAKPEIIITAPVEVARTEYKGESSTARAKLTFFQIGPIMLELIEPVEGKSTWKDHLDEHGPSLHHIAFEVDDIDGILTDLGGHEMTLVQRGEFDGGRYAYLDGQAQFGAVIELLEND